MLNTLPASFFEAETRSDFYVDEKRKKIWAVELGILEELDRVCKKYNLRYLAEYGTLLGAVRHKGFIPWDDDIDLVMYRDDYNKLLSIADEEFKEPYAFLTTYNSFMVYAFSKIVDVRTTAIGDDKYSLPPECKQGIFIDIFPLDDAPDGQPVKNNILKFQTEILFTLQRPQAMQELLNEGKKFNLDNSIIQELLNMDPRARFREFENFCTSNWGSSSQINYIGDEALGWSKSRKREWYEETIYLDFENIKIPCPIGYDEILKAQYGDYMTPVRGACGHEHVFFDPDKPYTEYLKTPYLQI